MSVNHKLWYLYHNILNISLNKFNKLPIIAELELTINVHLINGVY